MRINILRYIPAGTWRKYNVASTSMQRHDVEATLYLRHVPAGMCFRLILTFFLSLILFDEN